MTGIFSCLCLGIWVLLEGRGAWLSFDLFFRDEIGFLGWGGCLLRGFGSSCGMVAVMVEGGLLGLGEVVYIRTKLIYIFDTLRYKSN